MMDKESNLGISLTFTISEDIMKRINQWDQCVKPLM